MEKYLNYAKHIGADEHLLTWIRSTLKNYLESSNPTVEEVEHILDFFVSDAKPKRLARVSYEQAKVAAEKWNAALIKKAEKITEVPQDTETVLDFKDGFKVVKLIGKNAYEREGYLMRHCVASYYGSDKVIYSLRDANNEPHCTMEQDQQIKGKGNGDVHPKYIDYVVKFLKKVGMTVGDSEMLHLGYINVSKFKKYLGDKTTSELYDKKYFPKDKELIDKDGNLFSSLDLLDQIPLVSITETGLKINFELDRFIKLSIDFLFKRNTKKVSGDYAQLASSGDSAKLESDGTDAVVAGIGYRNKAKAKQGSWIVLAEYDDDGKPICVKTGLVGKDLEPDVLYILKNGKFEKYEE